jgi:carbon monoxide dehydrogenase subunit G
MLIENRFEVPLPPDQAWDVLMDIERVAPCMPGAQLTQVVDDRTYKGTVGVKLGPVSLTFAGEVLFESIDAASHSARVKAQGRDAKGRGGANATVDFHLVPVAAGSEVQVRTDLSLSGAIAQYGRASGMIQDVATQLIGQFATALKAQLGPAVSPAGAAPQTPAAAAPPAPKPISGFGLLARVLWNAIRRWFGVRA